MEEKKEKVVGQMKVYSEHMTPQTDKDGNEIKDENGNTILALDIWSYCVFFAEKIQHYVETDEKDERLYDGLSIWDFNKQCEDNKMQDMLNFFLQDEKSYKFQLAMEEKYNVKVNAAALFMLCQFISSIVKDKLIILLNPTIKDTLESISELNSITFENIDGTTHTSKHKDLLDTIMSALKEQKEESSHHYTTYKLVKREDIFTKEIMQAEFVYYLSQFFHQYFDIPRKCGGLITKLEQEMVCYYLQYFGLSATEVSDSRFRQLKNIEKDKLFRSNFSTWPDPGNGQRYTFSVEMIKYKYWKDGKINALKVDNWGEMETGDTIEFTHLID